MATKRGNGEGNIRQRENGKWEARITHEGRSHSFYGDTRAEVAKKLIAFQRDRDIGKPPSRDGGATVEKFLLSWLEMKRGSVASPGTYERYSTHVRLHIIPALGKHRLSHLAPQHIQKLYSEKRATLAPRTVHHVHSTLHSALEYAIKQGLVYRNVSELTKAPKVRKVETKVWTPEEVRAFLSTAELDRLYALYCLALATTMRQGELFGLHWRDVDLDAGMVKVRTAVRRSKTHGVQMAVPKTDSGRRVIPIAQSVATILRAHYERQGVERVSMGGEWEDHDLVFTTRVGSPLHPSAVDYRCFRPLVIKAGVPIIRFHDLRHTAATILIAQGVPVGVVSQMLGHTSAAFTQSVYIHVLPGMGREAANIIGRTFW
jgi:integrase